MLKVFKQAVSNVIGGVSTLSHEREDPPYRLPSETLEDVASPVRDESINRKGPNIKYPYNRPEFLNLNLEEIQVAAYHSSRPILVPRDISKLPWSAGYSE